MPAEDHGRRTSPVSDPRIKFLTSASQLVQDTSTSTSAFLGSQQLDILRSKSQIIPGALRRSLCCACGSSKLTEVAGPTPPASGSRKTRRRKKAKAVPPLLPKPLTQVLTQQCMTCDRYTRILLPLPPPKLQHSSNQHTYPVPLSTQAQKSEQTDNAIQKVAQRTGKQRAKMRKANELASLLQSSKKSTDNAAQLDLMDFLR